MAFTEKCDKFIGMRVIIKDKINSERGKEIEG
jgi:hypothetical protein